MRVVVIGVIALAILVVFIVLGLALVGFIGGPSLLRARQEANEASTMATLRTILFAQLAYSVSCGGGAYAPTFEALVRPPAGEATGFLPGEMGGGQSMTRSGYRIAMTPVVNPQAPASCTGLPAGQGLGAFALTASPEGDSGRRHFGVNTEGTIYEAPTAFVMPASGAPTGATVRP